MRQLGSNILVNEAKKTSFIWSGAPVFPASQSYNIVLAHQTATRGESSKQNFSQPNLHAPHQSLFPVGTTTNYRTTKNQIQVTVVKLARPNE